MNFPWRTVRIGKCLGFLSPYDDVCKKKLKLVSYRGRKWVSSRLSYHLNVRPIPFKIGNTASRGLICHTCDNSWCIEPSHLYYGTRSTNAIDLYTRQPHKMAVRIGVKRTDITKQLMRAKALEKWTDGEFRLRQSNGLKIWHKRHKERANEKA